MHRSSDMVQTTMNGVCMYRLSKRNQLTTFQLNKILACAYDIDTIALSSNEGLDESAHVRMRRLARAIA